MKGRKHELNLDPNFNPLDPAQVSDPKCWIIGAAAEALRHGVAENISAIRPVLKYPSTPVMQAGELDVTDQVAIDEATGKILLKSAE